MDSNLIMKILLIGAGQLGSRHLQGLLKLKEKQTIFVLDPSAQSLTLAKQRSEEIDHKHEVRYVEEWDSLPSELDLTIIATNSNIREQLTTQLLEGFSVRYLILEKVLFQQIGSYERIGKLIKRKNVKVWVNHPRRMFDHYRDIQQTIQASNEPIIFNLVGGNWGLGCNGLHFIDFFTYLTKSEIEEIDTDWLDNIIYDSKRQGYIEFTGTLKGRTKNNDYFTICSFQGETSPVTMTISSTSNRWLIQEGASSRIFYLSKDDNFRGNETWFNMDFQSSLTTKLVLDIFNTGSCYLPTYEEASCSHVQFIEVLLKKYNMITDLNTTICPIT